MDQLVLVLRRRIRSLFKKKQFSEATALVDEFRNRVGLNEESQGYQLEQLLGVNQLQDAKKLGERLVEQYPRSPRIAFLMSQLHHKLKNYKQAVAFARIQNDLYPTSYGSYQLAKCLVSAGGFDEALSLLRRLDLDAPKVQSLLGWLFERQGEYAKAQAYYQKSLAQQPENIFTRDHLEHCLAMQVDSQSFLGEMETLTAFDEEIPDNLLPTYFKRQLEAGEEASLREFVASNWVRFTPELCRLTGWACYKANSLDLTFRLFLEYIQHDQSDFKLMRTLEFCARKLGRIDELVSVYYKLAKNDPTWFGRIKKLHKGS